MSKLRYCDFFLILALARCDNLEVSGFFRMLLIVFFAWNIATALKQKRETQARLGCVTINGYRMNEHKFLNHCKATCQGTLSNLFDFLTAVNLVSSQQHQDAPLQVSRLVQVWSALTNHHVEHQRRSWSIKQSGDVATHNITKEMSSRNLKKFLLPSRPTV